MKWSTKLPFKLPINSNPVEAIVDDYNSIVFNEELLNIVNLTADNKQTRTIWAHLMGAIAEDAVKVRPSGIQALEKSAYRIFLEDILPDLL